MSENEIQMIYLLIKYHGVYGQIDAARSKGELPPNYDNFVAEMKAWAFSMPDKELIIKALFLFNIIEGLQSDVYSADFYSTDKIEDILLNFKMVNKKV